MRWRFWKKNTADDTIPIVNSPIPTSVPETKTKFRTSDYIQLIGNGRYQTFVNILMGMISFADCAEILVTCIIILALGCEWNLSTLQKALIPGMILLGSAIGSFVGGKIADTFGRKSLLLFAYYTITIASIFSITAQSYYVYIVSRFICGFGISMSYPVAACYIHEFSVVTHRTSGIVMFQIVGVLGGIYVCVCSLFVMELEEGWRWELALTLLPALLTLIALHFADESPRYYVANGQYEKALGVLQNMARWNGRELPEMTLPTEVEPHSNSYFEVYKQPYTRMSVIISIIQFSWAWCYTGITYFIPDAMSYSYCYLSDFFTSTYTDQHGCTLYTKTEYFFYLAFTALYIPGLFLGGFSVEYFGRKPTALWTFWTLTGLYMVLLVCIHYSITIAILALAYITLGTVTILIWVLSPELYPSYMRTTSNGILNTFNRLGAAGGAFFTEYVDPYSMRLTVSTYIVLSLITAIACLFINRETKGSYLKDTRSEVSSYGAAGIPLSETNVLPTTDNNGQGVEVPNVEESKTN